MNSASFLMYSKKNNTQSSARQQRNKHHAEKATLLRATVNKERYKIHFCLKMKKFAAYRVIKHKRRGV